MNQSIPSLGKLAVMSFVIAVSGTTGVLMTRAIAEELCSWIRQETADPAPPSRTTQEDYERLIDQLDNEKRGAAH